MNAPKVSIIMPSLNVAPYIEECIESAIHQTLQNIEIICVDAGSVDGTLEILEKYKKNDTRIQIINSDKKSYGYQINLGLSVAKGEYFAILETDDYIKSTMYAELSSVADRFDLEVLKADYAIFTGSKDEREFTYKRILPTKNLYNKILDPANEWQVFKNYVVSWSGIYKTEFLKKNMIFHHESPGASFQDNGFWFQVFTQAHRVMFYDKTYYMLRRDNPNSSVFNPSKADCMFKEYDFIFNFLLQHNEIESRYKTLYAYKRFKNLLWANDHLVNDTFRETFIMKMSTDMRYLFEEGMIDPNIYSPSEYNVLITIVDHPQKFFSRYPEMQHSECVANACISVKTPIDQLKREKEELEREIKHKERIIESQRIYIEKMKQSISFRFTNMITRFFRKTRKTQTFRIAKKLIQHVRIQGYSYTASWILRKFKHKAYKFLNKNQKRSDNQ